MEQAVGLHSNPGSSDLSRSLLPGFRTYPQIGIGWNKFPNSIHRLLFNSHDGEMFPPPPDAIGSVILLPVPLGPEGEPRPAAGDLRRDGELRRELRTASKKVLTENLRELKESGLVVRRDLGGSVGHVEYDFCDEMRPQIQDHLVAFGETFCAAAVNS